MSERVLEAASFPSPRNQVDSWPGVPSPNGKSDSHLPADIRPTLLEARTHRRTNETVKSVNDFFLKHWPFKTDAHGRRFAEEGLPWYVCALFPLSLDERLHRVCRLLTLGFLIDDLLDRMSVEEGTAFTTQVVQCARGLVQPDRGVPAQWIMYDVFVEMRAIDKPLADDVLRHVVGWLEAQDGKKFKYADLKEYFEVRDADFGRGLSSSTMRFCADLHLSAEELELVKPIEQNALKHMTVVNDICSLDKEVLAAKDGFELGAICSSVPIVKEFAGVNEVETKRIMWQMVRAWEMRHFELFQNLQSKSRSVDFLTFLKGLEYQVAGNELWTLTTRRYNRCGTLPLSEGNQDGGDPCLGCVDGSP